MRIKPILVLCLSAGNRSIPASAQDATVAGTVTDSAQAVIPGVHIRSGKPSIQGSTGPILTSQEGAFTITSLPPGRYELIAEHPGFRTHRSSGIVLEIGQTLRADY